MSYSIKTGNSIVSAIIIQALALTRYTLGEVVSYDNPVCNQTTDRLSSIDVCSSVFERHYTALSLQQHIEANDFVKKFKPTSNYHVGHEQFANCLKDDPRLEQTLNLITVDEPGFTAYFSSQLSSNERLLLSTGIGSFNPQNQPENQGLPTPSQLQHVFDVLSNTVSTTDSKA